MWKRIDNPWEPREAPTIEHGARFIHFILGWRSLDIKSCTGQMVFYVAKNVYDVPRLLKTCFMFPWGRV